MPVVMRIGPYRFLFFAADQNEPAHVHVKRDRSEAKFWIEPVVRLENQRGFAEHELNRITRLVNDHREFLLERWNEYFRQ
jgi:hypothetical protein